MKLFSVLAIIIWCTGIGFWTFTGNWRWAVLGTLVMIVLAVIGGSLKHG